MATGLAAVGGARRTVLPVDWLRTGVLSLGKKVGGRRRKDGEMERWKADGEESRGDGEKVERRR